MKRHIPGLHSRQQDRDSLSKACSWSESMLLPIAGIRRNLSCPFALSFSSPNHLQDDPFRVGCTAPNELSGS